MRIDKKLIINLGLIVTAVALVIGVQMIQRSNTVQANNSGDKDCVCHAAGHGQSPDTPTQYICIHPSDSAVTDNANGGHLNEDTANHAPDFLCSDCSECGPAPTPTPTPTPTPSPTPGF